MANAIVSGLGAAVTGNINKAYILLHRPELNPAKEKKSGSIQQPGLAQAAASLKSGIQETSSRELGISSSVLGIAGGVDKNLQSAANAAEFIPVQVQFNPASISFQGNGGEIRRESVGGAGENEFQQFDRPAETILGMDLYFDDTNNKDAFMVDAELPLFSEIASAGGMVQRLEQGVSALTGKSYSVQDVTELFVAAMVQNFTRLVGFAWNKMIFWGELTGVSLNYTMFNKAGAPIRAKVSIQIRQDQSVGVQGAYATEDQWEEAFEKLFSKS